jgi:hypothetical protein
MEKMSLCKMVRQKSPQTFSRQRKREGEREYKRDEKRERERV